MEGRNNVPNLTAIAMVLVVFSQGGMVLSGLKQRKK
jgi:TATA-box binding protein (TBP) (component of TFIID and TFIIIB)